MPKHPGGRPLKFQSVEELKEKIDRYFDSEPENMWTITGLALALDTSRKVLMEYEEKDEFSNTIKTAKQRVENSYEKALRNSGRAGEIFALKNFGWRDRQEVEHSGEINRNITEEELNAILERRSNNQTGPSTKA